MLQLRKTGRRAERIIARAGGRQQLLDSILLSSMLVFWSYYILQLQIAVTFMLSPSLWLRLC